MTTQDYKRAAAELRGARLLMHFYPLWWQGKSLLDAWCIAAIQLELADIAYAYTTPHDRFIDAMRQKLGPITIHDNA